MAKKTPQQKAAISEKDFALILGGIIRTVHFNRASLCIEDMPVTGAPGFTERRFVMEGPSGKHTLLVDATGLARLNAHWTIFATDTRNAIRLAA